MLHIPILRKGEPYTSLDVARVAHHQTGEPFVEISQANVGLIRRDLRDQQTGREKLLRFSTAELVTICERAADYFANDELPLGDASQSTEDYVAQVSATTGLPHVLARRNMQKIRSMLAEMKSVLNGLTRNLSWEVLDRGFGEVDGHSLSFFPRGQSLGVVLPNNSPGRAFVVDSCGPFEDASGAQAWQRRTLDALSHHSGLDSRGRTTRGIQFLSG